MQTTPPVAETVEAVAESVPALGAFQLSIEFGELNWIAILVATLASFMLGGLWYGPLFGKAWLGAVGKTEEEIKAEGGAAQAMGVSFITQLLASTSLAVIFQLIGLEGWDDGALIGLLVGVGFIASSMASDYAFCSWSAKLWLIQSGYRVVYTALSGAILGQWIA